MTNWRRSRDGTTHGTPTPLGCRSGGPDDAEHPRCRDSSHAGPFPARLGPKGNLVCKLVTTTDHKLIGIMLRVACFIFFFIGGLMALSIRTELAVPGCSS